jgi:hypothetical protein
MSGSPPGACHAALYLIANEKGIVPSAQKVMLNGAPTPVKMMMVAKG